MGWSRAPLTERIRQGSTPDADGCWIWQRSRDRDGYGRIGVGHAKVLLAHRVSYAAFIGVIPDGLTVDHLCFVPSCVNPGHLRLLTLSENSRNQRVLLRSACGSGHEYTPDNLFVSADGKRHCRACWRRNTAAYKARLREVAS